jgi:hypothetical protein
MLDSGASMISLPPTLFPLDSPFVIRHSDFVIRLSPSFLGAFQFEIDSSARKLTMVKVQGEGKK